MKKIAVFLATGLGTGFIPGAPGTAASVLAALVYWFFFPQRPAFLLGITIVSIILSVPLCGAVETFFGGKDDRRIVLDEIVGFWVSILFVPHELRYLLVCFILFRLFDITKRPLIDKTQSLPGGWGIVIDDVLAGIFANIGVHILIYVGV